MIEEVTKSKEEENRILAEKYMKELESENLGFTWRNKLKFLQENGYISETEENKYKQYYLDKGKTSVQKLAAALKADAVTEEAVKCKECGEKINSGTYGIIFNSNTDDNIVVKGSIQGHSITTGCPENFTREFDRYQEIKQAFPSHLNIVSLINIIGNVWVEERRCYFKMEKLYPIEFNAEQMTRLNEKILTAEDKAEPNRDFIYNLTEIKNTPRLYMLVPGVTNPEIYFNEGGNGVTNGWREINEPMMRIIFEILGIDIMEYYSELIKILKATMEKGLYLIDVEFILCSTFEPNESGELIRKNKVVMIDFDKVKRGGNDFNLVRTTLEQDMFPLTIQDEFLREMPKKIEIGGKNKKTIKKRKTTKTRMSKRTIKNKNVKKNKKNKKFI
jgi:hypothetical protein